MDDLNRIRQLAGLPILNEDAPPGWEGTTKTMKKHKEIDNPWALSWYMKNKGYHSHKTKSGKEKHESVEDDAEVIDEKWDSDYETPESKKGMWDGWSKERLEQRRSALRNKEERTDAESTELKQVNFALRAKSGWGDVDETIDEDTARLLTLAGVNEQQPPMSMDDFTTSKPEAMPTPPPAPANQPRPPSDTTGPPLSVDDLTSNK
jgi:hypothetical protein